MNWEIKEIRRNVYDIKKTKESFQIKYKKDWKKSSWIRRKSF